MATKHHNKRRHTHKPRQPVNHQNAAINRAKRQGRAPVEDPKAEVPSGAADAATDEARYEATDASNVAFAATEAPPKEVDAFAVPADEPNTKTGNRKAKKRPPEEDNHASSGPMAMANSMAMPTLRALANSDGAQDLKALTSKITDRRRAKPRRVRRNQRERLRRQAITFIVVVICAGFVTAFIAGLGRGRTHGTPIPKTPPNRAVPAANLPGPNGPGSSPPATVTADQAAAMFPAGALIDRPAPAPSPNCAAPAAPSPAPTVPAAGNAVSIVHAPAGVGFPALNGSSPRYTAFSDPAPFCINPAATYTAAIHTDAGTYNLTLLPKVAPQAVNSFLFLAGYHYFDGTVFSRSVPGFIVQGGDPLDNGVSGPGYSFPDELPNATDAYIPGAVGMANSFGQAGAPNGGANTNGSQFFNAVSNLDQKVQNHYPVFGMITSGMNVVDAINHDGSAGGTPTQVHRIMGISITQS